MKADQEIVLAAVKQNGHALKYACPHLKDDKEIAMAAVTENGSTLKLASTHFKKIGK